MVDYLGLAHELKKALATYTESDGKATPKRCKIHSCLDPINADLTNRELQRGLHEGTMLSLSLARIAAITDGLLVRGASELQVQGVFTDTRAPVRGGLFVALSGCHFDGHEFLEEAYRGGAAAMLVSRASALWPEQRRQGCGAVLVADTREAYLRLASQQRARLDALRWFAVTGSAGKSTVKEMLAWICSAGAGWQIHSAPKSFNNEIGVPATILGATPEQRAVVLEIGTNAPGEIERLARVARPQVAVITNAGPVHLEALGSVAGVAEEKSHLLDFQHAEDLAVLPADDPFLALWRARAKGRVLTFGIGAEADFRGEPLEGSLHGGPPSEHLSTRFRVCVAGQMEEIHLPVPGRHNILNALAAGAAAWSQGVRLDEIARGLRSFSGVSRRLEILERDGLAVIDDAYNASPLSFLAALDLVRSFAARGRRCFIVAGDMLELGAESRRLHEELGVALALAAPHALATVGPCMRGAGQAAVRAGFPAGAWLACATPEEAAERLRPGLRPGDVVLVKGSRSLQLERCIAHLRVGSKAALAVG